MLGRLITLLVVAWASFAAPPPAAAAGTEFPRGSRIGLEPPGDIVPSKKFAGFEDAGRNVAITLLDLPEPAYQAFERSAFANTSKTLTVDKRELFAFRDGIGFLVSARETVKGTDYRSWYLFANITNSEVGHIAAVVAMREPEATTAVYPDQMVRAMLATVTFRKLPVDELLAMLPFKVSKMAGFRLLNVAPRGAVVLIDGQSQDLANNPYMVISIGRGAPEATELRPKFAQDLLNGTPIPGLAITSGEPIRINSQQGFELRAKATGPNGKSIALVQWLRFGGNNAFLRVIGVVDSARWDEVFPRFREVRDGIERR
jgi:hypothetical protein